MSNVKNNYVYFRNNKKNYDNWADIQNHLANTKLTIQDVNKINNIVNFIGKVAKNERIKELHSITSYFQKYKNELSYLKNGSKLMYMINNPESDLSKIQNFYEDFTLAINLARRDTQEVISRINTIKRNIDDTTRSLVNYQEDNYRFSTGGTLTNLLNRIIGQYSINRIDSNSLDSKIHEVVIDILLNSNIPERLKSGEQFAAIASMVLIDVEKQAQKILDEYMKNDSSVKTFRDIADEIFPKIKEEYQQALTNKIPTTEIQKALLSLDDNLSAPSLSTAVRNTEQILNINVSNDINLGKQRLAAIEKTYNKGIREESRAIETKLQALRSRVLQNSELSEGLFKLTFTRMDSRSAHGNLNELIEGLFGEKVRANVATDVITYTFGYELQKNNGLLDKFMYDISEELSSIGDYLQTKNKTLENFQTILDRVNNNLTNTVNKLEQFAQQTLHITDKIFIAHETLKLSIQAEHQDHAFKGRTMSIFSYIDYLASAGIGGGLNINSDDLKFLAYNLIPGAIADDQIGPLEKYFSLFAGMLMFDDVQNMASEAVQQLQSLSETGQVEQLHLYNLNGVYVPASMILEYTYQGMLDISQQISDNYAAQAHIILSNSNNHHSYPERAKDANRTKVNITFLAGFTTLINNLFNAIN